MINGYFSRKLHDAETRYSTCDNELLGVRDAIEHWRYYLKTDHEFRVQTDHSALQHKLDQPMPTGAKCGCAKRHRSILSILNTTPVPRTISLMRSVGDPSTRKHTFRASPPNSLRTSQHHTTIPNYSTAPTSDRTTPPNCPVALTPRRETASHLRKRDTNRRIV